MNLLTIILIALPTTCCWAAENSELSSRVELLAASLSKAISSERWTITHDEDSIEIESKFELEVKRRVSPSLSTAATPKTKYRIELQFQPDLPKEEFVKISNARMEQAVIATYGAPTKEEYSSACTFLREHPLPRYRVTDKVGKGYAVYFKSTDSVSLSFLPVALYAEARGVEGIVDSQLWPSCLP